MSEQERYQGLWVVNSVSAPAESQIVNNKFFSATIAPPTICSSFIGQALLSGDFQPIWIWLRAKAGLFDLRPNPHHNDCC